MDSVKILMEKFWIDKSREKELFVKIRREIPKFKKFVTEQIGWRIIENRKIIKIEKVPAYAYEYMGITEFTDIFDYCVFSALLIFLEDREDNESFLLSELIDVIEIHLKEFIEIDWTLFTQRKSLVRILQFAEKIGFVNVYEGTSQNIYSGIENEVLYENTGLSRYFATSFNFDISDFKSYKDFEKKHIEELEKDKGLIRINRVYRELVSSPAVYWTGSNDQDAVYIKSQQQYINKNLNEYLGGELQLHKNSAFLVMQEKNCFGDEYPKDSMISELILLICTEIRQNVNENILKREVDDCIYIIKDDFKRIVDDCRKKYFSAWSKEYREMNFDKLVNSILNYMQLWRMLDICSEKIQIFPAVGKFMGEYPKDFIEGSGNNE